MDNNYSGQGQWQSWGSGSGSSSTGVGRQGRAVGNPQRGTDATMSGVESALFRRTMAKVFTYMFAALLLTAIVAAGIAYNKRMLVFLYSHPALIYAAVILQLVIVITLNLVLRKAKPGLARVMLFLYAFLTGITFSSIFVVYTESTIFSAFAISALTFLVMGIWGYTTKRDLTGIGAVGRMLLWGAIMASLVNVLFYFVLPGIFDGMSMILNYVVVAIFVGLTAYDMQRIKDQAFHIAASHSSIRDEVELNRMAESIAVIGALHLYLDFINLFIRILRILGRRRS